jgi:hypothetical protein
VWRFLLWVVEGGDDADEAEFCCEKDLLVEEVALPGLE